MSDIQEKTVNYQKVYVGAKVKGIIISLNKNKNEALVALGPQYAGFVKLNELTEDPNAKLEDVIQANDVVNFVVLEKNDREGTVELSKIKYDEQAGAELLEDALDSGETVTVTIKEAVKGGLVAAFKGARLFIPQTLAAEKGESMEALVGTKQDIKVLESKDGRKLIGSIKAIRDEQKKAKQEEFWAAIEEGKHYDGVVKTIKNYGAFLDLGGVDGFIHLSELTWEKIKQPGEVLRVGQTFDVFVKSFDKETGKVSLGHKLEKDNPWVRLENEFPVGSVVTGKVISTTGYGAFVNILPCIDGLLHISEMSNERVKQVSDVVKAGQQVEVRIIGVDFEKKNISLSMKQVNEPEEEPEEPTEE